LPKEGTLAKAHLHITGKVQGVGYRISAQEQAQSLGLTGWVKNLPDGSVLAEAAGSLDKVQSFIRWCERGPAGAQVTSVKVTWINGEDKLQEHPINNRLRFKIIG
jgi:acylphosphatase